MEALGQFHPQIVHTPVALLVFSAFFAIVGRLFDRDWVRKASILLLVFGFAGAIAAFKSGEITHRVPEHEQGVPEHEIDEHAEIANWTVRVAGAAVLAYAITTRLSGGAATAVTTLAFVLQLAAAVLVGVTGYRGGELTFRHGANVRIGGVLVKDVGAGAEAREGDAAKAPPGDAAKTPDRDDDGDEKK